MSILKWAGNKTKALSILDSIFPSSSPKVFIEPFCGSLSVALYIKKKYISIEKIVCNDINFQLITTYLMIRDELEELLPLLKELNKEEYNLQTSFNELRKEYNFLSKNIENIENREDKLRLSALMIYLNKRCFNGLYRENSKGEFNVPYRKYSSSIFDEKKLRDFSNSISSFEFYNLDFSSFLEKKREEFSSLTKKEILIYLDPPYFSDEKMFTSYSSIPFGEKETKILLLFIEENIERMLMVISNHPSQIILNFSLKEEVKSFIFENKGRNMRSALPSSKSDKKKEIIIYNF